MEFHYSHCLEYWQNLNVNGNVFNTCFLPKHKITGKGVKLTVCKILVK